MRVRLVKQMAKGLPRSSAHACTINMNAPNVLKESGIPWVGIVGTAMSRGLTLCQGLERIWRGTFAEQDEKQLGNV